MTEKIENRCMKCKCIREMKDVTVSKMKNGAFMAQGICAVCGCKMSKILSKATAEKMMQ